MPSDVTLAPHVGIVSVGTNRTSGSPGHTGIPWYTGRVMSMSELTMCITIPGQYFSRASIIILPQSPAVRIWKVDTDGVAAYCSELSS
jgi:hypothetical protein